MTETPVRLAVLLVGCSIVLTQGCGDKLEIPRADLSLVRESRLLHTVKAARTAVAKAPKSASVWGQLGRIYLIHGWEGEAAKCFERAAEIEPRQFRWFYYLGKSLEKTDPAKAVDVLGRSITLDTKYPPGHVVYAHLLRNLGRHDEARQQLERVVELDPQNPFGELGLGQLAISAKRFEAARAHLQRALALNPGQSEAHQALAQVYLVLGEKEKANQHAQAARKPTQVKQMHDPLWEEVEMAGVTKYWFARRGNRFLRAGDFERAVAELAEAISVEERAPMFWYNYGAALLGAKRYNEAVAALERALAATQDSYYENKVPPESILKIYNNLGLAYAKVGDMETAEHFLQQALALNPASYEAINNLVVLYYNQSRLAEAIKLLQSAEEVQRDPRIVRLLDRLLREKEALR